MTLTMMTLMSLWAAFYTGSLTWALWRKGDYRSSIGTGLLTACALVIPPLIQMYVEVR